MGNRKKLTSEVSESDLEYVDDMALISDSYGSLFALLKSIGSTCHRMGLTINYKKTNLLAVLPECVSHPPFPIVHRLDCEPNEVVPCLQYLRSSVCNNFTLDVEISARITKHLSHVGHLTAFFGTRERSYFPPI